MADAAAAATFGKVKARKGGRRKRRRSEDAGEDAEADAAVAAALANSSKFKHTAGSASSARVGKASRGVAVQDAAQAESGGGGDVFGAYASSGAAMRKFDAATAERTLDTGSDADGIAVYERKLAAQAEAGGEPSAGGDLVARSKDDLSRRKALGTLGPMRAPSNIRSTTLTDHQPDICKDYYETGYCGWGDSCKFLHMREKFTAGWKQEAEWQARQRKRNAAMAAGLNVDEEGRILGEDGAVEGEKKEDEELPFACFICREPWERLVPAGKAPVVTQCGHYTCEACALHRYKNNSTCAACSKETYGVFNRGGKVLARLKAAQAKAGTAAPAPAAPAAAGGGWGAEVVVTPAQ